MESAVTNAFTQDSSSFFKDRSEYDAVSVLLLYWKDGDLEVENELTALRALFGSTLNYLVASYPIPSDGSQQAKLHQQIGSLIAEAASQKRSLVIIYYTGHCREWEGKAEWAARRQGGPTLNWSDIQVRCLDASGDVLLILDCCHATLFSQGRKNTGRFEVLAACAKGLETPLPGEGSFTWALLKALDDETLQSGITAHKLRQSIAGYSRETPFWDSLGGEAIASIPIKRLHPPSHPNFIKKPTGYLFFRASLLDDIDGIKISEWLKTNAPKEVSAVHIEAIVLKARRLQKNLDQTAFPSNSILRKLSPGAQAEILQRLQSLDTIMAASSWNAKHASIQENVVLIPDALGAIEASVDAASTSIETPILLDLSQDKISQAASDEHVVTPDTLDLISLRNHVTQSIGGHKRSFEIPRYSINFPNTTERFNPGRIGDQNILLELFHYIPTNDGDPYPETILQVKQMTTLLCHDKRLSFHILPCLGYMHDRVNNRFGLVFQPSPKHSTSKISPITLKELYTTCPRVPLGTRISLVHALITALENFHRVGWVHKSIRSENIAFFELPSPPSSEKYNQQQQQQQQEKEQKTEPDLPVDFSSPWLFGFEYARAVDAGTQLNEDHSEERNLYRHPERWGEPKAVFTRAHDIYSLGVVLLEIAMWAEVRELVAGRSSLPVVSRIVRGLILKKLRSEGAHRVGDVFAGIIEACFGFEEKMKGRSEFEMQRYLQRCVLERIKGLVGKV